MTVDEEHKGIIFFGRDITKIPCMRDSILYSAGISVGAGLLGFLFTSRPVIGFHTLYASYCASMVLIFTVCRTQRLIEVLKYGDMQDKISAYAILESTENCPVRKPDPSLDDV